MIFKSRQVNTDPHPYVEADGSRFLTAEAYYTGNLRTLDPRREFNVTRDPAPWNGGTTDDGPRYDFEQGLELNLNGYDLEFDPRPEFDHPVNRILVALRKWEIPAELAIQTLNGHSLAYDHIDDWCDEWEGNVTSDEIDHARRVLTRLANMKES